MDGHLSDKIHLEQGVPQGDIISPYIFIIAVEILLIKITKSKNIQGVKIGKKECKAQTFADDTTILIKRDEASLRASILYIEEFKLISGLATSTKQMLSHMENLSTQDRKSAQIWTSNGLIILNFWVSRLITS